MPRGQNFEENTYSFTPSKKKKWPMVQIHIDLRVMANILVGLSGTGKKND